MAVRCRVCLNATVARHARRACAERFDAPGGAPSRRNDEAPVGALPGPGTPSSWLRRALLLRRPSEPDDELAVHELGVVSRSWSAVGAVVVNSPDARVGGGLSAAAADVGAWGLVSEHVVDRHGRQRVVLAERVLARYDGA